MATIAVRDLARSYGAVRAVDGISFSVAEGEVFALLGPNGAGKTTTVEILEGYRARDAGTVEVLGFDPGRPTCSSSTSPPPVSTRLPGITPGSWWRPCATWAPRSC